MTSSPNDARPAAGRAGVADVLASLVVFMVALPLCLAIAEASGLPAEAGILTGVVGGIVVGLIAGSPLQVSGPAAGLIVLVQEYVRHVQGNPADGVPPEFAKFALVVVLAGVLQLAGGLWGLGHWFRAVSPAVVLGMLAGIGAIILVKQFHVMFDTPAPAEVADAALAIPSTVRGAVSATEFAGPPAAAAVAGMTLLIMVAWKAVAPKRFQLLPAAVVAVVAATLFAETAGLRDVERVEVRGLGQWFAADNQHRFITSARLAWLADPWVWEAAVVIALIASAESLLCASAVDSKQSGPRTRFNRELAAQGVGNVLCGAVGALPMTGVIVRSSANLEAGARTRLSAVLHGVWLLLFAALLTAVLERVPMAALAAVLVFSGWKLLDIPSAYRLWRTNRGEWWVFAVTFALVVLTDLLTGVLIGLAVSAARLLWVFTHLTIRRDDYPADNRVELHLFGAATFLRLPNLADELERVPRGATLVVHLDHVRLVDHAMLEMLTKFQHQFEAQGGTMELDTDHLRDRFRKPSLGDTHAAIRLPHTGTNGTPAPMPRTSIR